MAETTSEAGKIDPETGQVTPGGEWGEMDVATGLGSGAVKGAGAGAQFGPLGIIIGGALGATAGAVAADMEAKKYEKAQREVTTEYALEGAGDRTSTFTREPPGVEAGGKANLNQTENLQYGGIDPTTQKLMGPVLPSNEVSQKQNLGGVNVNNRGFSSYSSGGTLDTNIPADIPQNWG